MARCIKCGDEVVPIRFRGRQQTSTIKLRLFSSKSRIDFEAQVCFPCSVKMVAHNHDIEAGVRRLLLAAAGK